PPARRYRQSLGPPAHGAHAGRHGAAVQPTVARQCARAEQPARTGAAECRWRAARSQTFPAVAWRTGTQRALHHANADYGPACLRANPKRRRAAAAPGRHHRPGRTPGAAACPVRMQGQPPPCRRRAGHFPCESLFEAAAAWLERALTETAVGPAVVTDWPNKFGPTVASIAPAYGSRQGAAVSSGHDQLRASLRQPAAIHIPDRSTYLTGCTATGKQPQLAQLLRGDEFHRRLLFHRQLAGRPLGITKSLVSEVDLLLHQRGQNPAGTKRIAGNAGGCGFQRDGLGQTDHTVLGRDIGGFLHRSHQPVNG